MILDMIREIRLNQIKTELFIRGRKLNILFSSLNLFLR